MDVMLSPDNREAFRPIVSETDAVRGTTCADMFVTLLQTITERYECLSQPGHQMQFLDMQLELLDDFRVRLLQIANAEDGDVVDSKLPMIANSFYYVESVLSDWGSMLVCVSSRLRSSYLHRDNAIDCKPRKSLSFYDEN